MTQDEIIRMMKEAERYADKTCYGEDRMCNIMERVAYERFAALVAEATKRDILKLCASWDFNVQGLIRQIEDMK